MLQFFGVIFSTTMKVSIFLFDILNCSGGGNRGRSSYVRGSSRGRGGGSRGRGGGSRGYSGGGAFTPDKIDSLGRLMYVFSLTPLLLIVCWGYLNYMFVLVYISLEFGFCVCAIGGS